MDGLADDATGDNELVDDDGAGDGRSYWCTLSGRGRRHCESGSPWWWCDAVELGGCDWGGGCGGVGEGREWEPCRLARC